MLKKLAALGVIALGVLVAAMFLPVGISSAQGLATRTPTPTGALGGFFGGTGQTAATPTAAPAGTNDPVKAALAKSNYVVITSGPWYDDAGLPLVNSPHVFMLGVSNDPKSAASLQQITAGFAALRAQYPNATIYHVLLLNGANVYDAVTSASALALLSSQLITPEAWVKEVVNNIRTINLVKGAASSVSPSVTPQAQATATRAATLAPTRVPTKPVTSCQAPPDKARLSIKNGYSGVMRFTVGGGEWGTHDFDIPADGKFHYIDMSTGRYTYSASIPGVGKANGERKDYIAGQCYELTFSP